MILYLMYSWCYKHFSILLNFNELIAFQKLPSSTLFLPPAVLDLCRCMGSSNFWVWGYSLFRCAGFSLLWLPLSQSMGSGVHRLSSRDPWAPCLPASRAQPQQLGALLLWGTWDLLGPRIEPVSPALADRFFVTKPPGKPSSILYH